MSTKYLFSLLVLAALLLSAFAPLTGALAASPCGDQYTVVQGDTLRKIAQRCDTTAAALERANPQIKNPNVIHPGQVLVLPGALLAGDGNYDIYVVARGDTLRAIARRFGTTVAVLLDLNREIVDANTIYEGQRLKVPVTGIPDTGTTQVYVVQRGDTLRKIAARFDTTVDAILKANPQIKNANVIYTGQRIKIPVVPSTYTVQRGDTLRIIAGRFNTTVARLLQLNPGIKNPDIIFVGQVLRIR